MEIYLNRDLKLYSRVGESEGDFTARCRVEGEARADAETAKLRAKYVTKAKTLQDQLATAQDRSQLLATQAKSKQGEELLSAAGSLLGSFLGGRRSTKSMASKVLGGLGGAAGRRRTAAAGDRAEAAHDKVARIGQDISDLETRPKRRSPRSRNAGTPCAGSRCLSRWRSRWHSWPSYGSRSADLSTYAGCAFERDGTGRHSDLGSGSAKWGSTPRPHRTNGTRDRPCNNL